MEDFGLEWRCRAVFDGDFILFSLMILIGGLQVEASRQRVLSVVSGFEFVGH